MEEAMRPKFCPNCAAELSLGPHRVQKFTTTSDPDLSEDGWDCFCNACSWSGDIYPDYATTSVGTYMLMR